MRGNESRFQRWQFGVHEFFLGRCPQARMNAAPLALNTCSSFVIEVGDQRVILLPDRETCVFRSFVQAMKIQYFQDTDTLYIEFKAAEVAETKDLDENMLLDVDREGNICGITVEHASQRADIPRFSYEQIAA